MIQKGENDIHQNIVGGEIKARQDCFNILNKTYPEQVATEKGVNAVVRSNYKEVTSNKKSKESVIQTNDNRPDFSDLLDL